MLLATNLKRVVDLALRSISENIGLSEELFNFFADHCSVTSVLNNAPAYGALLRLVMMRVAESNEKVCV